jgi:hypothetical protein
MSEGVYECLLDRLLYLRGSCRRGGVGVSLQRHCGVAGLQLHYHTVRICRGVCVWVCVCERERERA